MEYPSTKPHHIALHELRQSFIFEKYEESFERVLSLTGDDIFARLQVLYDYHGAYYMMGRRDETNEILQRARDVQVTDALQTALQLLLEARFAYHQSDLVASENHIDTALSILTEKSGSLYDFALLRKAARLLKTHRFDEVISIYCDIIERSENVIILADALNNLGIAYKSIGQHDAAEEKFKKALLLYQELGYSRDIAGSYNNLSPYLTKEFDAQEDRLHGELKTLHQALDLINRTSDAEYKCNILRNIVRLYAKNGQLLEALKYVEELASIAKQTGIDSTIARTSAAFGAILGNLGRIEEALKKYEECVPYIYLIEPQSVLDVYEGLCTCCSMLGLNEKGFMYSQKRYELKHEYDQHEMAAIIDHNKRLLEQAHRHENEMQQLKLKSVEERMRSQAAQLVSQTEMLARFRDELREIARKHSSTDPDWRAVKEKLKDLPCKQVDWEKFETEFAAVHPEFTKKLYERYPTLTPMEVKMCSLVRLNLKSQEIGRLFCLSDRTVENHRFNIRKKLGLGREQSISVFLNSL